MKKELFLLMAIAIMACKEKPKNYVAFSGSITNMNSDSLFIYQESGFTKTIRVNEDGTFKDTLNVKTGLYAIYDGNEFSKVFLKNGYDLNMSLNTKEFDESITYTGIGAESNNYLAEKSLVQEKLITSSLFDLEEDAFKKRIGEINTKLDTFLNDSKNLDSTLIATEKLNLSKFKEGILGAYQQQKAKSQQFDDFIGKPSPSFKNYENFKGGTTSLSDLKGNYVYVDVWATWCGPCLVEIPSLKKIESQYHGKNIKFVSISIDDGRGFRADTQEASLAASKIGWKKMIVEKELGGIQLFSDNGWQSDFVKDYKIMGIPRFILIDPKGNIVSANAPRPSSPVLLELFDTLNI